MEQIKKTKKNEWFTNVFLKSFDPCKGKRITEKQANIFIKYLKPIETVHDNAFYYGGIVDDKKIIVQESSVYNGSYSYGKPIYRNEYYLTIKQEGEKI